MLSRTNMAKIMLVEDDMLIQKTVEMKLKKESFEVLSCNDGKSALEQLEPFMPDIILTDMMLPYVSGLQILIAAKAIKTKQIKVIVFSTMGQEKVVEEAFDLGADDYITKPFSLTELCIRIKKQLRNN